MKIVAISDTHLRKIKNLPDGDILVHAGDWGKRGSYDELAEFTNHVVKWKAKYEHVIIVSGNHDGISEENPNLTRLMLEAAGATYLLNQEVIIDGIKFFGSPVTPKFFDWSWMRERGDDIASVWAEIPDDVNVLITHGPPYGILDQVKMLGSSNFGEHVGCEDLLKRVGELKSLKLHVFGHIHEEHGQIERDGVIFVNASQLDERYKHVNSPIVVEI